MVVAQAAAVGVEGQLADAGDQVAVGDEGTTLALGAKAQVFERHHHGDGEGVVDGGVLDVGGLHASFGKGTGTGPDRAGIGQIDLAAVEVLGCFAGAEHTNTRTLQGFGDLWRDQDDGAAPVGHHAAVEPVQRIADHG